MEHGESLGRIEIVLECALEIRPDTSVLARAPEDVAKRLDLGARLLQHLVAEIHRLAPVGRHEIEEERFAAPPIEGFLKRDHVPERLRHLLAREPQHAVVHPHVRKLAACSA